MVEVINLRQKRKEKARKDKDKKAEENRVKFGRTKQQKKRDDFESHRSKKEIDDKKLND
ncbi:MAG: DUF4169 family protein [Methylocystaceae bacterium]|nr:DUF4169 family protein [Methylocystaceae bacterium]